MATSFPETSVTLIAKIKSFAPGEDSAQWMRFWNLYAPAMRAFAVFKGGETNADDIVHRVLTKLVDVLRTGQFDPAKGRFHSYLATMIYNEVHMQHRRDLVRKCDQQVPFDETLINELPAPTQNTDEDWKRAIVVAATEHVLTRTALSPRDRAIYNYLVTEGHSSEETAQHFHLLRNTVNQIKSRIEKRIAAIGREMVQASEQIS